MSDEQPKHEVTDTSTSTERLAFGSKNQTNQLVIALDVDGVLMDFDNHWRLCAEERLQRPVPLVTNSYSFAKRFNLPQEERVDVWNHFTQNGWMATVPFYPNATKMIEDLRELGASIWAVSSVYTSAYAQRCESLQGFIEPEHVICVGSRELDPSQNPTQPNHSKIPALRTIGAHVLLDDLAVHLDEAQAIVQYPVLMERHYDGFESFRPKYSVHTHDEFTQFCRGIYSGEVKL
jgi:hypothetical protein